jgi:hypothetical protein
MWPAFWILIGPQCQLFQANLQHNICRIDMKCTLNLFYKNEHYPSHCITEEPSTYNTSYCTDTNTCLVNHRRFAYHVLQTFLGQTTSVSTIVKILLTLILQNIGRKHIYPSIRLTYGIHALIREHKLTFETLLIGGKKTLGEHLCIG